MPLRINYMKYNLLQIYRKKTRKKRINEFLYIKEVRVYKTQTSFISY